MALLPKHTDPSTITGWLQVIPQSELYSTTSDLHQNEADNAML